MVKVLFICLGNICRSPMAEFIFRDYVARHGAQDDFEIASAATSNWEHGNPVHSGTVKILKSLGLKTDNKTSRPVTRNDFYDYDWIIGMDLNNVTDLKQIAPCDATAKVASFLSVVPELANTGVPDPYYSGNFKQTYELVQLGTVAWFEKLQPEN
ncbi:MULTISPECIES: low molecular weight protein-tyrosine-phosphatase [unclassified Enterococcus]|uniref:low molecular weight protein-tyrosine-phosphatase n=1 Tax=unclassified Enterococcus TaxID=2608891 RepID=UPI00155421C3|nr:MULTISPECIES: low molecular weight protein-tyrosine-phosphatase [unclassified Enterococcus]MBS7576199.1 low molecular weight phosphotyrosine protein phosphatase [Enterococcus sp. MMGLQ5-2]MBS7583432.1 low molecular weight phosphotyrosine protein phosphatase [Enterococcus sp. MMGLQ5-1]NPD11292.1 low molecular weight phosphotyrosine protein phosphatase [Enterococcus sp. MMGLQ5-1]NPD36035.1 low molecular weight phosphotyrosine protein phosphatase [Enterococcus sp. MMGLQ5-2]